MAVPLTIAIILACIYVIFNLQSYWTTRDTDHEEEQRKILFRSLIGTVIYLGLVYYFDSRNTTLATLLAFLPIIPIIFIAIILGITIYYNATPK